MTIREKEFALNRVGERGQYLENQKNENSEMTTTSKQLSTQFSNHENEYLCTI